MFCLVGLRKSGEMVVYDTTLEQPTEEDLESIAGQFNYTQMLLIDTGGTNGLPVARYEYDDKPRVRKVSLIPDEC